MEEKKKLLLIINPVAGRAEVRHNLVPVLEIFESAGYMVTVFVTGKSGDASDIIIKYGKEYVPAETVPSARSLPVSSRQGSMFLWDSCLPAAPTTLPPTTIFPTIC